MTERKIRKLLLKSIPIETERLVLRHIKSDDACDMFEYASKSEVCEYLLWSPHINLQATEGYIEFLQKRYMKGLYGDWAIEHKQDRKMIGTCGYASVDSYLSTCEIGYVLSPNYRGQGYMTEAVKAVLELTFDILGLENATLRIINENKASKKLAEDVGFTLERIEYKEMEIKGEYRDIAHYLMTKSEYERKKEAV